MSYSESSESKRSLWERILKLVEEDLAQRRDRKVVIEVQGEPGLLRKEIAELSAEELRSLDLGRHTYTKAIGDLTPTDLPAVIAADLFMTEEQRNEGEREEFAQMVRQDLDGLPVAEPVEYGLVEGRS
jgi:hypothetical protein